MNELKERPYSLFEAMVQLLLASLSAFFVLLINETEPLLSLLQLPGFGRLWIKNVLMNWMLIALVRHLRRYQIRQELRKQGLILFTGGILLLLYAYAQSSLYFYSEGVSIQDIPYFNTLFPLTLIFLTFLYFYQIIWDTFAYQTLYHFNLLKPPSFQPNQPLQVFYNRKLVHIKSAELKLCQRQDRMVIAYSFEDKKHTIYHSIKSLDAILQQDCDHFLINEGTIVHWEAIEELEKGPSRTGLVYIQLNGQSLQLSVSQGRKRDFDVWYRSKQRT